jgi:hypothetical protein
VSIADYARVAVANLEPRQWFRVRNLPTFGGIITQKFIDGRGGFLSLRSMQDNTASTNGLDINETGDVEVGGKVVIGADAGIERKAANVLGPLAGDSLRVGGISGETLAFNAGTANAAVATTLGSVGPTGSTAGNPLGWLRVNVAGTDRFVPYW